MAVVVAARPAEPQRTDVTEEAERVAGAGHAGKQAAEDFVQEAATD